MRAMFLGSDWTLFSNCCTMPRYAQLVMGPAGSGKVCKILPFVHNQSLWYILSMAIIIIIIYSQCIWQKSLDYLYMANRNLFVMYMQLCCLLVGLCHHVLPNEIIVIKSVQYSVHVCLPCICMDIALTLFISSSDELIAFGYSVASFLAIYRAYSL